MLIRLTVRALVGLLLTITAITAIPTPASAATHCNDWAQVPRSGLIMQLPSIGHNGSTNCILSLGDANPGVFVLQNALRLCNGAPTIQVDARYGEHTRAVVLWIQVASGSGVAGDGVYGPETANRVIHWPMFYANGVQWGCSGTLIP